MENRCAGDPMEKLQPQQISGAESGYWFGQTSAVSAASASPTR